MNRRRRATITRPSVTAATMKPADVAGDGHDPWVLPEADTPFDVKVRIVGDAIELLNQLDSFNELRCELDSRVRRLISVLAGSRHAGNIGQFHIMRVLSDTVADRALRLRTLADEFDQIVSLVQQSTVASDAKDPSPGFADGDGI